MNAIPDKLDGCSGAAGMPPIPIEEHEGSKYVRQIWSLVVTKGKDCRMVELGDGRVAYSMPVDVYCVLDAFPFARDNPEIGHAVKKLLMAGGRRKGDAIADLKGVLAAVSRAIERLEVQQAAAIAANPNLDTAVVAPGAGRVVVGDLVVYNPDGTVRTMKRHLEP